MILLPQLAAIDRRSYAEKFSQKPVSTTMQRSRRSPLCDDRMKTSASTFWRDVAVICAVTLVVSSAFWLLLHTHYRNRMPEVVQDWAPVFIYVVTTWFLIDHRLKNPPQE